MASVRTRSKVRAEKALHDAQRATLFVSTLPIAALLVLKALVHRPELTSDGATAGITAVVIMTFVVAGIYRCAVKLNFETNLISIFLTISTFTSACDLGITGYLLGVWELGSFYPSHGEKYFGTAFGVACLGWDGVVHLLMQGYLCRRSLCGQKLGPIAFMWAGSVINSMIPLLLGGAATGKYSPDVEFSTALNAPYVIIPILIAIKLMDSRTDKHVKRGAKVRSPATATLTCLIVVTHIGLIVLHVVRTMSVVGSDAPIAQRWLQKFEPSLQQNDGTNIILIQTLQSFFWLVPYHCVALWEAFSRFRYSRRSLLANAGDWAFLVTGAYLQSCFIRFFMTVADYQGPGQINYELHRPTTIVTLFVCCTSMLHAILMNDE